MILGGPRCPYNDPWSIHRLANWSKTTLQKTRVPGQTTRASPESSKQSQCSPTSTRLSKARAMFLHPPMKVTGPLGFPSPCGFFLHWGFQPLWSLSPLGLPSPCGLSLHSGFPALVVSFSTGASQPLWSLSPLGLPSPCDFFLHSGFPARVARLELPSPCGFGSYYSSPFPSHGFHFLWLPLC
jgi:hypothetical protein